ncbi:het [Diplodia corticola]|uniref:Het n=1 Tax=Diplodia corticola TaxID=236234 RepID=A0A1J9RVJ0_9PEZI|nr:het [Diplodia corticola]OJD31509.1 het [Diplodia corticola]
MAVPGPSNPSVVPGAEECFQEPPTGASEASHLACEKCRAYFLGYAGSLRRISQASVNLLLGDVIPKPRVVPRQISYGTLEDLSARKACRFCEFLFRLIKAELELPNPASSQEADSEDVCSIVPDKKSVDKVFVKYKHVAVTLTLGRKPLPAPQPNNLFRDDTASSQTDPEGYQSVSIGMIKSWMDDCQKPRTSTLGSGTFFHSMCHHLPPRYGVGPWKLTFIDVVDRCLVTKDTTHKYFALSYVWGKDPFLQTTTENVSRLEKKHSLTRKGGVPALIDDAMELTNLLGVRYIWVDALCLVQNDRASKYEGIRIMHIIYAHADLTVVAASAKSASSPLSGLRKGTRCPHASRDVKGRQLRYVPSGTIPAKLSQTVYQTRGWTMQELLMSRRCLVFTYDQVYYRCLSAAVSELGSKQTRIRNLIKSPALILRRAQLEDLALFGDFETARGGGGSRAEEGRASRERRAGVSARAFDYDRDFPSFATYMHLVQKYSCRQLSYQSDILNAFSAVQSALGLQMDCGFEFGLPLASFGMALLWRPCNTCRPERRTIERGQSPRATFPTWSWIGWREEVLWVEPVAPDQHYDIRQTFEELVPFSKVRVVDTDVEAKHGGPCAALSGIDCSGPSLHRPSGLLVFEAEVVGSRSFRYREARRYTNHKHKGSLEILPMSKAEGKTKTREHSSERSGSVDKPWKETSRRLWEGSDDGLGRGIVFSMEAESLEQSSNVDLVALSTFRPRKIWQGYPGLYYHFNEGTGGYRKGLPFLNCLVIEWHGDYAERIGVAQIGSLAWRDAGPTVRCITIR